MSFQTEAVMVYPESHPDYCTLSDALDAEVAELITTGNIVPAGNNSRLYPYSQAACDLLQLWGFIERADAVADAGWWETYYERRPLGNMVLPVNLPCGLKLLGGSTMHDQSGNKLEVGDEVSWQGKTCIVYGPCKDGTNRDEYVMLRTPDGLHHHAAHRNVKLLRGREVVMQDSDDRTNGDVERTQGDDMIKQIESGQWQRWDADNQQWVTMQPSDLQLVPITAGNGLRPSADGDITQLVQKEVDAYLQDKGYIKREDLSEQVNRLYRTIDQRLDPNHMMLLVQRPVDIYLDHHSKEWQAAITEAVRKEVDSRIQAQCQGIGQHFASQLVEVYAQIRQLKAQAINPEQHGALVRKQVDGYLNAKLGSIIGDLRQHVTDSMGGYATKNYVVDYVAGRLSTIRPPRYEGQDNKEANDKLLTLSVLYQTCLTLLYNDPHYGRSGGCPTCRTITELLHTPFGCCVPAGNVPLADKAKSAEDVVRRIKEGA